jgi:hypothetical protein
MRHRTAGSTSSGLDPSAAAGAVVAGVKANRFIVTTHPDDLIGAAQTRLGHAQEASHQEASQ